MSTRDWIETGAMLVGGAGLGAALMYLFDPEHGDRRRAHAAEAAGHLAANAGETLGSGWEHLSHGAKYAADRASAAVGAIGRGAQDHAHHLSKQSQRFGASIADHAGDFLDSASDYAHRLGNQTSRSAHDLVQKARKAVGYEEPSHFGAIAGTTAGVIGALALGAGLMFLLDPSQGRRRRAMIRDRTLSAANRASKYAQDTGRYVADQAAHVAHSATRAVGLGKSDRVDDMTLAEQARSAIGQVDRAENVSCRVEGGRAILTGFVPASSVEKVVAVVREISGIQGVDNRLSIRDTISSM